MWWKWLPWRFVIRRAAQAHGFLDPIVLLDRFNRFAQPSEVREPIELLRAGVVLHARGLINSRVIQHNLDWVWPHWIERQFDPRDVAFVPRSFSVTHINLTHRNWTAIGLPDCLELPIVDPCGLVTPHLDRWSLDAWILTDDGTFLLPSRAEQRRQELELDEGVAVLTENRADVGTLSSRAEVHLEQGTPVCRVRVRAQTTRGGWLIVSLRPYNPEGISFVHRIALSADRRGWQVEGRDAVAFSDPVDRHHVSDYRSGDVYIHLRDLEEEQDGQCDVGMVMAAALFRLTAGKAREVTASVPLMAEGAALPTAREVWAQALDQTCRLSISDPRIQQLYDAAVRTLVLHSPGDIYPGPYTYKRFWFRDAAFIVHALLAVGLIDRAERALDSFPARQTASGYFHSQEGEWDSNGEALWIMKRFCQLSGRPPKREWQRAILKGANWICRKRLSKDTEAPHAGLLPAGFSAEHLGPNDFYYWDDFWGIAGLNAAASLIEALGVEEEARRLRHEAEAFRQAVDASLDRAAKRLGTRAMPASPYRRLDAGAIGSIAIGYPLQLCAPDDPRLIGTVKFLLDNCFVNGGVFQDMVHSGINPYLTLHVAQILLRIGDPRYLELLTAVAKFASPTGQWPEAIHPITGGGCMGDGQHVWAAAEWLLMLRNCFVLEEEDRLILGAGIAKGWLDQDQPLKLGPTPTKFGPVSIEVEAETEKVVVSWQANWHGTAPAIEVRVPGYETVMPAGDQRLVELVRMAAA